MGFDSSRCSIEKSCCCMFSCTSFTDIADCAMWYFCMEERNPFALADLPKLSIDSRTWCTLLFGGTENMKVAIMQAKTIPGQARTARRHVAFHCFCSYNLTSPPDEDHTSKQAPHTIKQVWIWMPGSLEFVKMVAMDGARMDRN